MNTTLPRDLGRLRALVVTVALAIVARLAVQLWLGFYAGPETWEQEAIAKNLLAGRGYVYDYNGAPWFAFASPLYALAIAVIYELFGTGSVPVGVLQMLLGGALAALVYGIAREIDARAALLAGLGTAAHPGLLVYAAKVHPLELEAVTAALGVLLLLRFARKPGMWSALGLGVVIGADVLLRPTLLSSVIAGIAVILVMRRSEWPAFLGVCVALLCGLLIASPWLIRNQLLLGSATVSTSSGVVLWIGNNPIATGGALTDRGVSILDASPEIRSRTYGRSELEQTDIFQSAAVAYMTEDPPRTVRSLLGKFVSFWWFTNRSGIFYPQAWLGPYVAYYMLLIGLAFVGVAVLLSERRYVEMLLLALTFAGVSLSQSVFFVEGRHRWAVEGLVVMLAATGTMRLLGRLVSMTDRLRARTE